MTRLRPSGRGADVWDDLHLLPHQQRELYDWLVLNGDSVLLGDSFAASYAAKLVAGTYGIYYRAQTSVTMPENENGRFACITVE